MSPADTAHVANQKEACIALIQALMNAALDRPPGDQATGFSQRMGQAAVNVLLKRDTRPREVRHIRPPPAATTSTHLLCLGFSWQASDMPRVLCVTRICRLQDPAAVQARLQQHAPDVPAFNTKVDSMRAAGCASSKFGFFLLPR